MARSPREDHLQSHATRHVAAILLLALATRAGAESLAPAAATRFRGLQASVVTYPAKFKKYLYSFPLPGNVTFQGLSGSVSTDQSLPGFSEALISLHYLPTGRCPQNGEVCDTYDQIAAKYPTVHKVVSFIVKNANGGVSTVPTQFMLPVGMPMSNGSPHRRTAHGACPMTTTPSRVAPVCPEGSWGPVISIQKFPRAP
jgi:hypothetical protein